MQILFEKFNPSDQTHLDAFVRWEQDLTIQHLRFPRFDEKPIKLSTREELEEKFLRHPNKCQQITVIKDGERVIGEYSIQIDPPQIMKKIKGTSWIGITIGDHDYWGRGVAELAFLQIEKESKELGAVRIELGVFEFNYRAYNFYKKMNFKEFGRINNFTYWDGKYWQDIRMEKTL